MFKKQTRAAVAKLTALQNSAKGYSAEKKLKNLEKKEDKLNSLRPHNFDLLTEPDRLKRAIEMWKKEKNAFSVNKIADIWNVEKKKLRR